MQQTHRAGDAVITICQDNARKMLEIREASPAALKLIEQGAILPGAPLSPLLPDRVRSQIEEYVEFVEDGNDAGTVLSRVQNFALLNTAGKEIPLRLKVMRIASPDAQAHFQLLLLTPNSARQQQAFRSLLQENYRGYEVLDGATGLPDKATLMKHIELVHYYVGKEALKATAAVVAVDNFERLQGFGHAALKHVAGLSRQNLRGDDCLGLAAPDALGVVLLDAAGESARMVLNRLRYLVPTNPYIDAAGNEIPLSVSIVFRTLKANEPIRDLLSDLRSRLQVGGEGNVLVQEEG